MAGAGFWRNHYRIEARAQAADSVGQASGSWSTTGEVRGSASFNTREVIDDLGNAVRTDAQLETAWHPRLDARSRLVDTATGDVWNVSSADDSSNGRRRRMRVMATRVIP